MAKSVSSKNHASHLALKEWTKNEGGRGAKIVIDADICKAEFTHKAGGHYELNCLLLAQEPLGMLTITGWAYLAIEENKETEILEYCSENSTGYGSFSVTNGHLVYFHSNTVDTEPGGRQLINLMISRMDEAVEAVAEGVLRIVNSTSQNK